MILFAADLYKEDPDSPEFGYCPHCYGLVWIVRCDEDEISEDVIDKVRKHRNRTQVKMLLAYCEENRIRVSKHERRAIAA